MILSSHSDIILIGFKLYKGVFLCEFVYLFLSPETQNMLKIIPTIKNPPDLFSIIGSNNSASKRFYEGGEISTTTGMEVRGKLCRHSSLQLGDPNVARTVLRTGLLRWKQLRVNCPFITTQSGLRQLFSILSFIFVSFIYFFPISLFQIYTRLLIQSGFHTVAGWLRAHFCMAEIQRLHACISLRVELELIVLLI